MTLVNSISMLSLHTNFVLPQFTLGECISLYVSLSFWSSRKDLVILLKCLFYTDVPLEEASDRPVSGGLLHGLGERNRGRWVQTNHRRLEISFLLSSCWWHSCFWRTDSSAVSLWAFIIDNYKKGLMDL